ncbi:hypothetical protein C9F11_16200 [Streptomyces sp. YIM 121038]|uniref:DUF397 domain-containing protein n=1 Tax=Streptomyces sp. YIM 121038 TaxID=2136401 RepID=UPI0011108D64|nr:DUF397 domain-containing protein [Streptomyces sp. YIM 121038]QCX76902.1 hypothetical protein C9F11_16200 [Streptomyces sp. YIM 121038]
MIHVLSVREASNLEWFKSSYSSSGDGNDCVEVALEWTKSSYSSGSEGDSCVEVALEWTKSSYSDSSNPSDCVEVAATPSIIHIRDSKNKQGPRLAFTAGAWRDFVQAATS